MGCGFDPEGYCGNCANNRVYYCACQLLNNSVEFVIDEMNACSSGYHCGLCPGGSVPYELSTDCPGDPWTPTEDWGVCTYWDPDSLITETSTNNFIVDAGLITIVEDDPVPLYGCDSARINIDSGNLVVEDVVSTDMVYLLGLRNGDQLVEINGMPLDGPKDAADAYAELWIVQNESEYVLTVLRSSNYVDLTYELLFSNP